jgi:Domain of unknown function (DUF4397)
MKKLIVGAVALLSVVLAAPAGTEAQADVEVMLLHGIPGVDVDVAVDGDLVIEDFNPGDMQDLSAFAGQKLKNLEVRAAGTTDVAIGPVAEFAVPSSGSWTVVAHLDAEGTPTITPFENETSQTKDGEGRLTVRHTAAAPAVDLVVGDARPIEGAANGDSVSLALPAGEIAGAKVAPAGEDPIVDVPTVNLKAGQNLIVYAVGSLADNTFTFYVQERTVGSPTAAGSDGTPAPTAVNSGEPIDSSNTVVLLGAALGLFALAGGATFAALRRSGHTA